MADHLADLALAAFRSSVARAQRRRDVGEWTPEQAEADVRPWAAAACLLGADIPELREAIEGFTVIAGRALSEAERRAVVAADLCPREWLLAALASARDASIERAGRTGKPEHIDAARKLMRLAEHFGCPISGTPLHQQERKAA